MRVPAPAPLLPAGCGAGSPGAFPAPLSASGYPAEVSLLGLGTFRLCACWATPGQRLPILAHGAARLRLRGHRHTTVTVTGELLPPTPCAPAPRRGLPALAPTWGPCFFWRGWGVGGEASTSGWRPGPVIFLGLPQAPQDSPHPRPAGEAPGLWEGGSLRSLTGLGLALGRHLQVPLGPLWDLRPVPRLMGFPQPEVLGPESGPQWLLTPEDRRVTHRALGTEEALEDRPRGWGCLGRALPGPSHQLPRRQWLLPAPCSLNTSARKAAAKANRAPASPCPFSVATFHEQPEALLK